MSKGGESRLITNLSDRRGLWRYLVAVWSVGVAFLLTLLLSPLVQMSVSPLFLAAVMFSAWRGGLGPGLLATLLSVTVSAFIFLPPSFSFAIELDDLLQLGVFSLTAIIISSLSRAREQAETELAASLTREQAARREAEAANELKDEFVAAVSHEMRTPLTTIKTLTRVMLRSEQTAEERRECVEDISSECDRQIDLVLNLLDLSRIKAGNFRLTPQPVKVDEVLTECLKIERFEAEERRQHLTAETLPELPRVVADHSALRRALCGLVENAIKYTPEGGSITLGAHTDGDEVAICITDTGRGIREEDVPRIFEKFYRGRAAAAPHDGATVNQSAPSGASPAGDGYVTEEQQMETPGIGLGLYLARNIVKQFGGRITVESEFGRGSIFTVHLPAWRDGASGERAIIGEKKVSEYV